jgi:F-type H+-transporting ATPase subunit epsilon
MSSATWRSVFTYVFSDIQRETTKKYVMLWFCSYNKYTQIAARAVRQSLREEERVAAEKRGTTALRYQHWEDGKGGEQVGFLSTSRDDDSLT